jgi:ubiquitin C-terminal hydrolase
MFVGQLKSTLKCTKCDYKSPTYELFWHLALPIPTKVSKKSKKGFELVLIIINSFRLRVHLSN